MVQCFVFLSHILIHSLYNTLTAVHRHSGQGQSKVKSDDVWTLINTHNLQDAIRKRSGGGSWKDYLKLLLRLNVCFVVEK